MTTVQRPATLGETGSDCGVLAEVSAQPQRPYALIPGAELDEPFPR